MKSVISILLFIGVWVMTAYGQPTSLDSILHLTRQQWPSVQQLKLNENIAILRQKNISMRWFPTLTINGQASYQSEAASLPIALPGINIPEIPLDQYKLSLDAQQLIYDGGSNQWLKKQEMVDQDIQLEMVNIDLKKAEFLAAEAFFSIASARKNKEILELSRTELQEQQKVMESRIANGVQPSISLEILKAEEITINQKIADIESLLSIHQTTLNILTGKSSDWEIKLPEYKISVDQTIIKTPEIKIYEKQEERLQIASKLLDSKRKPSIQAYAQVGYGRPGLNFFATEFDSYYLVGIRAGWTLWNYGTTQREKRIIQHQQSIVQSQMETYRERMEVQRIAQLEKISNINQQLNNDYEILKLREKIVQSYASQLQNGTITPTEYLTQLNQKTIASFNFEYHKISLLKEQFNYEQTFLK